MSTYPRRSRIGKFQNNRTLTSKSNRYEYELNCILLLGDQALFKHQIRETAVSSPSEMDWIWTIDPNTPQGRWNTVFEVEISLPELASQPGNNFLVLLPICRRSI